MNAAIHVSLLFVSVVVFAIAIGLRVAASSQPETPWSGPTRRTLLILTHVFQAIGLFIMLATAAMGVLGGLIGFILFLLVTVQFYHAELRIAGSRRRAQQTELLWMLALAVRSGRPLADEVESYAQGSWGKRHQRLLELAYRLRSGVPLSEIAVPQHLLPRSATVDIHTGLHSGQLERSLVDSAARHTRDLTSESHSQESHSALIYPLAVLMVMMLIVGFVMYYIVPKFKKIFDDFGTELPQMTVVLIRWSDLVVNHWYMALPLIWLPLVVVGLIGMADYYGWRLVWRKIAGRWLARPHSTDVLRALARAISAETPLDRALEPFVSSNESLTLQRKMAAIREALGRGESCWELLERHGFLTSREVVLIETAQRTRHLPWVLDALADSLERRWHYHLTAALTLMQPIVIVGLGIVVGFVAIAMFLPLIKLINDLS